MMLYNKLVAFLGKVRKQIMKLFKKAQKIAFVEFGPEPRTIHVRVYEQKRGRQRQIMTRRLADIPAMRRFLEAYEITKYQFVDKSSRVLPGEPVAWAVPGK